MDEEEGAGVSLHQHNDEDHDDGALFEDGGISIQMFASFCQTLNQF